MHGVARGTHMSFADPCRCDITDGKDSLQRFVVEELASIISE
jgi:hypothetical protein